MASTEQFATRPLYAGALTCSLPAAYISADSIRQIPDHQEVFLSPTSQTSVIFDVLTRAEPPEHPVTSDLEALRYHYDDVTGMGQVREDGQEVEESTRIWETNTAVVRSLGNDVPALVTLGTQHPLEGRGVETGGEITDFTALWLLLIRLEKQKTDVLVTINIPHVKGEYNDAELDLDKGKRGSNIDQGKKTLNEVLATLKIEDWSLFVEEDED